MRRVDLPEPTDGGEAPEPPEESEKAGMRMKREQGPNLRRSGERICKVSDRILGASGEIAMAVVSAALVAVCVWAGIEAGALHDGRLAGLFATLLSPFVLICVWCMRKAIRRWREMAEVQRMLDGMGESERAEFDEAVSQGDVEVSIDENGKRHFQPMDFG